MKRTTRLAFALAASVATLVAAASALAAPGRSQSDRIELKFREGTSVRLRGDEFVTLGHDDLSHVREVLRRFPGSRIQRLFSRPEAELAQEKRDLEASSGRQLADLNLYFSVVTHGPAESSALADALSALPIVEDAYVAPEPAPAPTLDYTGSQGYRSASPAGIDVSAAASYAGGKGDYVKVVDVEYSWNTSHEDLSKARASGAFIASGPSPYSNYSNDHGTAVLGELVGDANTFGVTGLVPNATVGLVNTNDAQLGYIPANAIDVARANMSAGDVMLIEQQTQGANGGCDSTGQKGCVAMEYWPAVYDAIVKATAAGIIVVEAAGNGSENLDGAAYGSPFPRGKADSGAIIVGAGGSPNCNVYAQPARSRLEFSTYGSRVNLQGWGECVMTTGYGDYFNGGGNAMYTGTFSGTSSASPIVAAAAASLSSAVEAKTGRHLTSVEVRSILARTGTAQEFTTAGSLSGNIGPLPDLARALQDALPRDTTAPTVATPTERLGLGTVTGTPTAATVPVDLFWSATDASGIKAYGVYLQKDGGGWSSVSLSSATATTARVYADSGHSYRVAVQAQDGAGNWSTHVQDGFTVSVADDTAWSSTSWTRKSNTDAFGGSYLYSSTAGAGLKYPATATDIGLISLRYSGGGTAKMTYDTTPGDSVSLNSTTTQMRQLVWWAHFGEQAGSHSLTTTVGSGYVMVDGIVVLS